MTIGIRVERRFGQERLEVTGATRIGEGASPCLLRDEAQRYRNIAALLDHEADKNERAAGRD